MGYRGKKRVLGVECGEEVEDGGAAVAAPSRAVDTGAGQACGLDLNDFIVGADAGADEGADSELSLFSEVGDSHDSMDEAAGVSEDDVVTASTRVQRQTRPVYKTA